MITTSQAWKEYSRDVGIFHIKAVIDNGTQMNLTDADFMQGSVSVTDSVSGMSDFTVGAVITNSFNATLNNFDGKFDNYNLAGAEITVSFGIIYEDETEEWIQRGVYTLEKPTSLGSTIKVVGYDAMDKLNRYYIGKDANLNDITFPIPADELAEILCDYCGVTFGDWELSTDNVAEFEYDESTTCRQVLSWITQAYGGYARINQSGSLDGKAFDLSGTPLMVLDKIKSLNVYVEDIEVTGVRAYAYNTVDEFQFDTVGTSGYILGIQDNPLVTDNTLSVATRVYNKVNGLTFRPFDASIIGDPSIEAGDVVSLEDYLGNTHISTITSLTYFLNNSEQLECNAKTPEEADLATANPQTSVIKGATIAAYDYITAKKISADYISAGTITGAVEATNFTMSGGSINIDTDDAEVDIIKLNVIDATNWKDSVELRGDSIELLTKDGDIEPGGNWEHYGVEIQTGHPGGDGAAVLGVYTNDDVNGLVDIFRVVASSPASGQIYILGDELKDFVVEEGTWGSYGWWRKWHSGKAEVHGYASVTTAISTPYAGVGYHVSQMVYFPSGLFLNAPVTNITLERNGGLIFPSIRASSKDSVDFYIASLASEASATVWFHVNAFGKWK